ncbi:hypothetical protein BS17DRAFT_790800, partial [Gyrodon lividus]
MDIHGDASTSSNLMDHSSESISHTEKKHQQPEATTIPGRACPKRTNDPSRRQDFIARLPQQGH